MYLKLASLWNNKTVTVYVTLGWAHGGLSPCFSVLSGVYLVLAAGALTQQRLAALVNVHSTIWKTAGQEHGVSVASDTAYTVHGDNAGGSWFEYWWEQVVRGWNAVPQQRWNEHAELLQLLERSAMSGVCFQTDYSHQAVTMVSVCLHVQPTHWSGQLPFFF